MATRNRQQDIMNVSDIMTASPITISAGAPLRQALEAMEANSCKHLPVRSTSGHIVGVLSDRDCRHALNSPYIMREKWQDEALIDTLQVRAAMTAAPIVVEPNTAADDAARLMLRHDIGCLPVMRAETLVGIVTRSDLLIAFITVHKHYEALMYPVPVTANGHTNGNGNGKVSD